SMLPSLARVTAGSMRSPAKPAPVPILIDDRRFMLRPPVRWLYGIKAPLALTQQHARRPFIRLLTILVIVINCTNECEPRSTAGFRSCRRHRQLYPRG